MQPTAAAIGEPLRLMRRVSPTSELQKSMFESLFKAFENFILEFSVRRLAGTLLLIVVCVGGFGLLERYSPYFVMGRLERATGLLERLSVVESRVAPNSELKAVRDGIIRQLQVQIEPGLRNSVLAIDGSSSLAAWRFVAGAGLWFFFALVYLPNVRLDPSNWNGVLGAVFLGTIWGFVGSILITDAWSTWKALVTYALGNFAVSVLVILIWQQRQSARARTAG